MHKTKHKITTNIKNKHSRRHGGDPMPGHRGPRGRGRGRGRGRRLPEPTPTTTAELSSWFAGSIPNDWFLEPPTVVFDRDEILVTGQLGAPNIGADQDAAVAAQARIDTFRADTKEQRIGIAERAQQRFERTVSWAVACGDEAEAFTTASVPVMTRLGMDERAILDTLIDAGVARSRSEALAWCVQLVADNEADWLGRLREAMTAVEEARASGPGNRGADNDDVNDDQ